MKFQLSAHSLSLYYVIRVHYTVTVLMDGRVLCSVANGPLTDFDFLQGEADNDTGFS